MRVRAGVYHQSATIDKSDLTIEGAGPRATIFDGAPRVTGFRRAGEVWVRSWNVQFDHSPTFTFGAPDGTGAWQFINPRYPMAAWPDQVWIDGHRLKQVATRSQMTTGSFYVDYSRRQLVIGTNPAGRHVEASRLAQGLSIRAPRVVVSGLTVRRYADSVPTLGAVTVERPSVVLRDLRINKNATSGLLVAADNVRVVGSEMNRNGLIGVHGAGAYHLNFVNNEVAANNLEHFNLAPVAGGLKFTRSRDVNVSHNVFTRNLGTAVWLDESTYADRVIGNSIVSNRGHGVNLEISDTAVVANNIIADNGGRGVQVNNTGHVRIWNNELVGDERPVFIVQDPRRAADTWRPGHDPRRPNPDPTVPWSVQAIQVRNNIISTPTTGNCLFCVEDGTHQRSAEQMGVDTDANLYIRRRSDDPRWLAVWSRGPGDPVVFTTLSGFTSATGQEVRSRLSTVAALTRTGSRTTAYPSLTQGLGTWVPQDISALIGTAPSRHIGAFPELVGPQ